MNAKYIEGLVEALGLEKAYTKKIPCPADNGRAFQAQKNGLEPLTPELHHVYRKGVGILLYLAPERPDVMHVLKKLSTKLASPTNSDHAEACCKVPERNTRNYAGTQEKLPWKEFQECS